MHDMQGLAWSGECSIVNVFELHQAVLGVSSEREPGEVSMANGAIDSGCTVERCSRGMCEQGLEAGKSWVPLPFGLLLLVLCPELFHVLVSQRFL